MVHFRVVLVLLGLLASVHFANAADIQVVGAGKGQAVPVGLSEFSVGSDAASAAFLRALQVNLDRWGWFRVAQGSVSYSLRGQARTAGGFFAVDVEAVDVRTGRAVYRDQIREEVSAARTAALRVVDALTEAIHGVPGIANTRIAFVGAPNRKQDLFLIGADGEGMVQLTQDQVPCFRPAWHTRDNVLFYTSFVRGFPDIYRLDLAKGRRSVVSREAGINAGASVSPDGSKLALVLSRDGNPEVYVRQQSDGRLLRITRSPHHAEASPVWSPDGRQLAYVSDMQGGPHVFIVSSEGGQGRRISRGGSQNVSPSWGPDGRIVYSSRRLGRFQLVIYDPRTGVEEPITDAPVDHENPSWARDGRHLVYARRDGRVSSLYLLDTRTGSQIRLTTRAGDWYFPAWSHN